MSVVLPVPFAPTSETCSPRSSQISASSSRTRPSPTSMRPPVISKTTRPERSTAPNLKPSSRLSRGSRSMRSILSSALTRDWAWRAFVAL